jgi:hypothetical protein
VEREGKWSGSVSGARVVVTTEVVVKGVKHQVVDVDTIQDTEKPGEEIGGGSVGAEGIVSGGSLR